MNLKIDEKALTALSSYSLPSFKEIPDVGLYLNQCATYINRLFEDIYGISITESMISNYVKKGLIANPVKKQYYREQIADIFFIATAKSVLSLENIQLLLQIQRSRYGTKDAYDYFCAEFQSVLCCEGGLSDSMNVPQQDTADEKIMLRNTIITTVHKIYLDKYFELLRRKE